MKIKRIKEIKQTWINKLYVQNLQENTEFYTQELDKVLLLGPEWSADEKDMLKGELFFIFNQYTSYRYSVYSATEKAKLLATINDSLTKYGIDLETALKFLVSSTPTALILDLLNTKNIQVFLESHAHKDDIFLKLLDNWSVNTEIKNTNSDIVFPIIKAILRTEPDNYRSADGRTVLHLVYGSSSQAMVLKLSDKYRHLVNVLDQSGNSPLYYAINDQNNYYNYDNTCNPENYAIFAQLMASGAKYIRNFIEAKNILHLRVAMHQPLELDKIKVLNIDIDAIDLESGRTALTHAVVLKNDEAALELIKNGASCTKRDNYNKSPLDYALVYGDKNLVMTMMEYLPVSFPANKQEHSFIAAACFSGNRDLYAWIKANIKYKTELDQAIIAMIDQESLVLPTSVVNLDYKQQLIIYAAVEKMVPKLSDYITQHVRSKILAKYVATYAKLPSGTAYGIELELSDVPCVPDLPLELMLKWFQVDFKHDGSVESSIFSTHNLCVFKEEIVSGVLDSTEKIKQFLLFSELMYNAGTTVGRSTGMHVHINIQGNKNINLPSITNAMNLRRMSNTDVELAVVKQIITNWVEIEPLLQSFLRHGELENISWFDHHYAAPIKPLLAAYMEAKTIKELIETSPSRYYALNVESLRKGIHNTNYYVPHGHGTIEIRIHEGAIHKLIIESWLNFIDRLVRISIDQVQDKINNNEEFKFTPSANVKDLVHILLAERNYELTWDSKLKSSQGSTAPVTISDWSIHEMIQKAEIYTCYKISKEQHRALNCVTEVPIGFEPHAAGNVTNWLSLTDQYPGIFTENSDFESHINSTNDVSLYPSAVMVMFMFACLIINMQKMVLPKPKCPLLFNYNSKRSELPLTNSDTRTISYGAMDTEVARLSQRPD